MMMMMYRNMKSINRINQSIVYNSNKLFSSNIKKEQTNVVVDAKDMSIHGLCLASIKEAFNNFSNYIIKNESVKLALGRWHVEKVSADWEKKSRYY